MSIPATSSALPAAALTTDRRAFLATLAAAGVMTGATLPASATAASLDPDAALIGMVASLFAAAARWDVIDARADEAGIFHRCEALMPTVPPALFLQEDRDTFEICYDRERLSWTDKDGKRRRFYAEERHVPSLRWAISKWREHGTGRNVIDRAEEIIAALDPYMAAVKRAEDLSGVTAFNDETRQNQALIDDLVKQITATPASTVHGVAAKARAAAITSWADDPNYLADEVLPGILSGEDPFYASLSKKPEYVIALSVVVDAMKLGALPFSTPVAA